jgi:erythromycin esterase
MTRCGFVFLFALWGCHGQRPAVHESPREHGVLHDASGHLAGAGIAVVLTDPNTGETFPPVYTDEAGQFAFSHPRGQYAVAATSPTQFAYAESAELPGTITMSADCNRVAGQATGTLSSPATLSFAQITRHIGAQFIASLDAHGHAEVCLPEAGYGATVIGPNDSLPIWIRVPDDHTVSIAGFPKAQLEAVPRGLQLHNDDVSTFARSLAEPTLIGMGEANHGTADFYPVRTKLSLELARTGSLRAILLEADAMVMLTIDDYVMGAQLDIAKAMVALDFWTTDTYEFLATLDEIRTYNAAAPPAGKVHVLGVDAQDIPLPSQFLLDHHTELAISAPETALLSQVIADKGKGFKSMNDGDRTALVALLDRLTLPAHPADLTAIPTRASIAARSLRLQLGYFSEPGVTVLRDLAMADLTQHVLALSGAKQAALWAHNGHLSRLGNEHVVSLGESLTKQFGPRYYVIAFMTYRGSARAWDHAGKIGVIPHELAPPPLYDIESVIMQATGTPPVAWIRLDQPNRAWQAWLATPRYTRQFGPAYDPADVQILRAFPAEFSAVVVLDHTTPTTPTPTGVRKAP